MSIGTLKQYKCSTCLEKTHVYKDKENQCSKCVKSLGPKDVIDIKVLQCLFCKNNIQTFYEYGIGLLMCTNCSNYRSRLGPFDEISKQFCKNCESEQPELWTKSNLEQCKKCWTDSYEFEKLQGKAKVSAAIAIDNCDLCGVLDQKFKRINDAEKQC